MTKLPEIITVEDATKTEEGCGYCGSTNCGSLYGDPICNELPLPEKVNVVIVE